MNTDAALDEMPLDRLVKAYALTCELIPNSQSDNMPRRVALRAGLLQRAYSSALARPASLKAVSVLLFVYLLVVGTSVAAWRCKPVPQPQNIVISPSQEETDTDEVKTPKIKLLDN